MMSGLLSCDNMKALEEKVSDVLPEYDFDMSKRDKEYAERRYYLTALTLDAVLVRAGIVEQIKGKVKLGIPERLWQLKLSAHGLADCLRVMDGADFSTAFKYCDDWSIGVKRRRNISRFKTEEFFDLVAWGDV